MDREKWDAMCKAQLEEHNLLIAAGPDAFARCTWEMPNLIPGGDKVFERTTRRQVTPAFLSVAEIMENLRTP